MGVPIELPILSTVKEVVEKKIFSSKKYRLALIVLMWSLTCWGSIPDCVRLVRQGFQLWRQRSYRQMVFQCFGQFTAMAIYFFVRRYLILFGLWMTIRHD